MKKLLLIITLFLTLNIVKSQDSNYYFHQKRGDEPWNTFDKKNIGGGLIAVGWTITTITVIAGEPNKTNKIIAYGVGPSFIVSGSLYWLVKGLKYKRKQEYLSIKRF